MLKNVFLAAGLILSLVTKNLSLGFLTRSDTNQAVPPQKMVRGLNLGIEKVVQMYSVAKTRTLISCMSAADLCLCFRICKTQVFS